MVRNAVYLVPGSHVFGSHGPLMTNPNASVKRRVRIKAYSIVVKTEGLHKWEVCSEFDGKSKVVTSRSLMLVPNDAGIPLNKESENSNSDSAMATAASMVDTSVSETYFVLLSLILC